MDLVVTGAAGFIGRHVVRTATGRGATVTGLDREPAPRGLPAAHWIRAELSEPDAVVTGALAATDGVIHLAGCPGVRTDDADVGQRRYRDNFLAGARVLAATPPGTPLVVVSSSSVYGGAGPPARPRPCHEEDGLDPQGGYAWSKAALEALARRRADTGGRVVIARPFTVAGPGQRPDMAIARWIDALRHDRPAVLLGGPARRRDVTDVRQVAAALVELATDPADGILNLGTGTSHRLDTMIAAVARVLDVTPRIEHRPAAPVEVATTLADPGRLERLHGIRLETDLERLVRDQVTASRAPATATRRASAGRR